MKKNSKFIEMENIKEIEKHIKSLKITRNIDKLQIHQMDLPDYDCWEQDLKRWGDNAELNRTNSLDEYGKRTWNYSDGQGRFIAQHFNVFPNGHVTTGRNINSTPIGIKGWNTGAICIEIYGDFDKGKDNMTKAQMQSIIALYGSLAKKLNIPINDKHIRCHCWFTSGGSYLGGYYPSKSAKTCPGEEFTEAFGGLVNGYGNSKDAINKYFYPKIKEYLKNGVKDEIKEEDKKPVPPKSDKPTAMPGKYIVRYLQTCLNQNYGTKLVIDGSFGKLTQEQVNKHYLNKGDKGEHVIWLQKALVNRGFNLKIDGSFGNETLKQLKAYQKSRKLKVDGYAGLGTHKAIIND